MRTAALTDGGTSGGGAESQRPCEELMYGRPSCGGAEHLRTDKKHIIRGSSVVNGVGVHPSVEVDGTITDV